MSRLKLPNQVPLPEIAQHTEDIVFGGGLGLPVGFDQERLLVNLQAIDRFRHVAGISGVSVVGKAGESEPADPGVDGVDDHGVATIGLAGKRTRKPLVSNSLQYPAPSTPMVGRPSAIIKVDNTELETRIDEKPEKYKKGAFDVPARAKFLNRAIKEGLAEVNFEASFNKYRLLLTGSVYAINGALTAADIYSLPLYAMTGPVGNILAASRNAFFLARDNPEELVSAFKEYRHSLFYGITPDRYIAAQGLLASRKLIKARS